MPDDIGQKSLLPTLLALGCFRRQSEFRIMRAACLRK